MATSGALFYYSGTGNTELAMRYVAGKISQASVDLIDLRAAKGFDLSSYDFAGFATFVDHGGPPQLFIDFIGSLKGCRGKPAFILITYGGMPGRTLKIIERMVVKAGMTPIAGHQLITPENFVPLRVKGHTNDDRPNEKEIARFKAFASDLNDILITISLKGDLKPRPIRIGIFNLLMPKHDRRKSKKKMGPLMVDRASCIGCGNCETVCPYGAIQMDGIPSFDDSRCYGCWACYNRCPTQAIYTEKIRGEGHYKEPTERLRRALSY